MFDPVVPSHMVVSTTFGLLESRDGGKNFLWRCEPAIGVFDQQDLMVAITASGATVTTRASGVAVTSDGCAFDRPSEIAEKTIVDLTLFRSKPHALAAISMDPRLDGGGYVSQVVRSEDDGRTWMPLGSPLPSDLFPFTIDAAPGDASRLYVTGSLGGSKQFSSALLRSNDGGLTFASADIPETGQHHVAYIAAVHPTDPDRVYVRVFDPAGTAIWLTPDGGSTFRKIFTGTDQLFGFALSPDGTEMAFGGPGDGIWVGASDGTNLVRRSNINPTCLGWTVDGIFACANEAMAGFALGRSRDEAKTFEPLSTFRALCGDTGCNPDSGTAQTCAMIWPTVGGTLGSVCDPDGGGRDATDARAAEPDASSGAGGSPDATHDAAEAIIDAPIALDAPDATTPEPRNHGCGCTLAPSQSAPGVPGLLVLGGIIMRRRRASSLKAKLV